MNDWIQSEATAIGQRLEADGFTPLPLPNGTQYHQRMFMLSRFGIVDRVVEVRTVEQVSSSLELATFEEETVAAALAAKVRLPRGLGSAVEVFTITLAAQAAAEAVEAAAASPRSRWSIMSTPALVHGPNLEVVMFEGEKAWGWVYVKSLRASLRGWIG